MKLFTWILTLGLFLGMSVIAEAQTESNTDRWALVYGYSQQVGGYPPNARYFDYVKVVSASPSTGEITLDRPLTHTYSQIWPEVPLSNPICSQGAFSLINCELGRGRIMLLGAGAGIPFGEYLYMENMTFLDNPNALRPGDSEATFKDRNQIYVTNVYHAVLNNITASNFVPTMAYQVDVFNSNFFASEVDKFLHAVNFTDTDITTGLGECSGADIVTYTGGSLQQAECDPRQLFFNGVTFSNPDLPLGGSEVGLSLLWPTDFVSITDSEFVTNPGHNQAIGRPDSNGPNTGPTLPVDGTVTTVSAVAPLSAAAMYQNIYQVTIRAALAYAATPAVQFAECAKPRQANLPSGQIALIKAGTSTEVLGTIIDISGDGAGDAVLNIRMADNIAIGDTLVCNPIMTVQLSGNEYVNFNPPNFLSPPAPWLNESIDIAMPTVPTLAEDVAEYATMPTVSVTPEQFGAVGDCVNDDTTALLNMRSSLQQAQVLNSTQPVMLTMNFGTNKCYMYTDGRWTYGLKYLTIHGNGASFQSNASWNFHAPLTTNGGGFDMEPWRPQDKQFNTLNSYIYLINTAQPGHTDVYLSKNQPAAANFLLVN
jgi:hypothetical protein